MSGAAVFVAGWAGIALLVALALRASARAPETLAESVRAVLLAGMDVTSPGREYSLCPRRPGGFVLYRADARGTIREEFFFDDVDLAVARYLASLTGGVGRAGTGPDCP